MPSTSSKLSTAYEAGQAAAFTKFAGPYWDAAKAIGKPRASRPHGPFQKAGNRLMAPKLAAAYEAGKVAAFKKFKVTG